jgi:DNA-binding PucR family transcriptional regulator
VTAPAIDLIGWDLDRPHTPLAFGYTGTQLRRWESAVAALDRPAHCDGRVAWVVLPAPAPSGDRELGRLRQRLSVAAGGEVRAASGPVAAGVRGAAASSSAFRAAEVLLRVVLARPGAVELPYRHAGLLQLLLDTPPDALRSFVGQHLGPILDRDDLLATLESWLATSGSRRAVSERLHLHRNSVGYRIGLIKHLLGVDPLDPEASAVLRTALAARELMPVLDSPPGLLRLRSER